MNTQHCRIGRNPSNDLVINDRAAEDFHAVIMMSDDNLIFIEDQNSRYGTLVNGERISKVQLFPGDEVQIGFSRIDWESRTSFQPALSEIEIIPNLSVPIKRPNLNNSPSSNLHSNDDLNHLNNSDASKELANTLIEQEVQMNRIENIKQQEEKIEISHSINEARIISDDHIIEISTDYETEEAIEDINTLQGNQDNFFKPDQSVQLPAIESIKEEVDINNNGEIENGSIENLSLELNQEIHQVEAFIATEDQSNVSNVEMHISDESNSATPPICVNINNPINEQNRVTNDSLKSIVGSPKSNLLSKDSIEILLAIGLTCLLLAAGWFIGQAS